MRTFIGVLSLAAVAIPGVCAVAGPTDSPGRVSGRVVAAPALARLVATTGSVNVRRGGSATAGPNLLRGGDRIVASSGGQLVYVNGCSVAVASDVPTYVSPSPSCGGQAGTLMEASYQADVKPGWSGYAGHLRHARHGLWSGASGATVGASAAAAAAAVAASGLLVIGVAVADSGRSISP